MFDVPLRITYKVTDETIQSIGISSLDEIKEFISAYYYDEVNQIWNLLRNVEIDTVNKKVTFEMEHFTKCAVTWGKYRIKKVKLIDPIKKGEEFKLKLYVESCCLTNTVVEISADYFDLWNNPEKISVLLRFPGDIQEPIITLVAPSSISTKKLRLRTVRPEAPKYLWVQYIITDYDILQRTLKEDLSDRLQRHMSRKLILGQMLIFMPASGRMA